MSKRKTSIIVYFIVAFIASIIFISVYNIRVINPCYTDWIYYRGELVQHYLGWKAYRASAWHFPIGMVDTLQYPNLSSVIFTDSIPLFAVIFKVLSPVLPENFQYFGLWGLLCFILQGVLTARILRKYSDNAVAVIFLSTLNVLFPSMIDKMFAHTALAGHWIILFGLDMIFNREKYDGPRRKKLVWNIVILAVLSASVHIYFVLISGIVVVGVCLLDVLESRQIIRNCNDLLVYIMAAAIIIYLFGGFTIGSSVEIGGLGYYSFNLNGYFNPQGFSCIFPDLPLYAAGQYEGRGYMGVGILLLVFVALVIFVMYCKKIVAGHWKIIVALCFTALISVFVAASPVVSLGDKLLWCLNLPDNIIRLWSIFRASGRVVWISMYIIEISAFILILSKLQNKTILIGLVCGAFALQVYDYHVQLLNIYGAFKDEKTYDNPISSGSFWGAVSEDDDIKHIVFYNTPDYGILYNITEWALDNEITVNDFYFARKDLQMIADSRDQALAMHSDDYLFVFTGDDIERCNEYALHYYEVDGMVVGCEHAIAGMNEME